MEDDGAAPTAVSFSADPRDCAPLTVTYESTQRPLAAESPVFVQIRFDQGANWNRFAMSNEGAGVWSYAAMVPNNAPSATVWFENTAGTVVDSNDGANWSMGIRDCLGPYDPVICAAPGSPQISMPPATNQNHPGDNFDFNPLGGAATTSGQAGFGSFGQLYINFDDTNLYVGAHGTDMAGDNNAMMLFLDVDTLSDDKQNLWGNSGNPRGLDNLHNVQYVTPMDLAILLGSENGDVTSMTGPLSSGFAFGQGVFRLAPADFPPVAGARISQFDGVDRYLSGNYLGASATGVPDGFHNFGFSFVQLTGLPVCLPHLDDDMDGLSNGYELRYWQNAGVAQPGDNSDGDAFSNLEEQALGTNPTNGASTFILFNLDSGVAQNQVTWSSFGGRTYAVEFSDDLEIVAFAEIGQVTETDVAFGVETTEVFIDDFTQTGASSAGHRTYRVRLVIAP